MPSQRAVVIPPSAILDPEFCQRYGRPLFAWHHQAGRVAAGGGGMAADRGPLRLRGGADSTTNWGGGGASLSGNSSKLDFGTSKALEFGAGAGFSMWALCKPGGTGAYFHPVGYFGTDGAGNYGGYLLQLVNNGKVAAYSQPVGSTFPSFNSNESYDTSVQSFLATVNLNVGTNAGYACYRNGVALTNAGTQAPQTPGYSVARIQVGNYNANVSNGPGIVYAAAIWKGVKPQRMAEMLDARPDMMWWWPGKNRRKVVFIPATAGQPMLVRYGGAQVLGENQFIPSGRRGW